MVNLRIINYKLYNQYYPLKTEEEKNKLLNSHRTKIIEITRKICDQVRFELYTTIGEFIEKTSPMGYYLDYNEYLIHKKLRTEMDDILEILALLEPLERKIVHSEYEKISLDELNCVLRLKNKEHIALTWRFYLLPILLIVCACIFI